MRMMFPEVSLMRSLSRQIIIDIIINYNTEIEIGMINEEYQKEASSLNIKESYSRKISGKVFNNICYSVSRWKHFHPEIITE